jgi:hypothetical protein
MEARESKLLPGESGFYSNTFASSGGTWITRKTAR